MTGPDVPEQPGWKTGIRKSGALIFNRYCVRKTRGKPSALPLAVALYRNVGDFFGRQINVPGIRGI